MIGVFHLCQRRLNNVSFNDVGRLINVFQTPKGNRDGKDFGGQDKIQVLGAVTLQNGEVKNQLIDLTCHDVSSFEPYVNEISFPVGVVALAKNQAVFSSYRRSQTGVWRWAKVQYSDTALLCITCTQEFIFHDYAGLDNRPYSMRSLA